MPRVDEHVREAMHFGIFVEERRRETSEATAFQEALELGEAADAWGLDGVWLGEIHFNPTRSVQSAPIALASFMAARTRRVRLGLAVTVLPLAHPLRIAEEVATVDQLSLGRFDLGIGRSGSPRAYDVLGVPYGESQARFEEALDIMRQAWKGEPFSYAGTFYRFQDTTVAPRPYQVPHPPMRMAANSPETFSVVGRMGLPLFVGLRDLDIPELRVHLVAYRAAWRQAGHPGDGDVCLRLPVYAAPTEREALEEPRENITYFFRRHAELTRVGLGRGDTGPTDRRLRRLDQLAKLSYREILDKRVAFGTAARLTERLAGLRDELGLDGMIAELNPGGLLPMDRMLRTLRILTHEVIPALR
jgi:alkanesulfonate monooxygenase SsuD/methylene tetrahydromethanopterin reductase-like flavin-dependent oxidoreductase (luciferase family)